MAVRWRCSALTLSVGLAAGSLHAQTHNPEMAKIGASAAGQNYEAAAVCGAPPDLLSAYKVSRHGMFAAVGDQFEAAFTAGQTAEANNWKDLVQKLGSARAHSSFCGGADPVAKLRAGLANR